MSVIPDILSTNAQTESQATRIESTILDADNHSWVQDQFGKSRFNIPKKGSILSPDGTLLWRTSWLNHTGAGTSATFPRLSGGPCVLDTARLYYGGKLLCETREVGQKIILDNYFKPYDAQVEVLDEKLGSNHLFGYNGNGQIKLSNGVSYTEKGTKQLVNGGAGESYGLECAVKLRDLFPMLKDMVLPMTLKGEIIVEINWKGIWSDCIVEGGVIAGADQHFKVARPRLHLDYISYSNEVHNAMEDQFNSMEGQATSYREAVLVQSNIDAPTGAGDIVRRDVELGFNNRSVMKVYLQKLLTGANALNRKSRSDGLTGEKHQLIVNNRQLYSRIVDNVSEMYSYLNQTGEVPFCNLDGTYDMVGVNPTGDLNTFTVNENNGAIAGGVPVNVGSVRDNYQGKFRYVGFNLSKTRFGNDTPSNAVNVGDAPLIVRLERNGSGRTGEPNQTDSANLNLWVECVKMLQIKNGEMEVFNI